MPLPSGRHLHRHMAVCRRVGVQPSSAVNDVSCTLDVTGIVNDNPKPVQVRPLGFEQSLESLDGAVLDVEHRVDPTRGIAWYHTRTSTSTFEPSGKSATMS